MRTLMMIASFVLLATGAFCIANSTVPFVSVAFIVGITFIFFGVCELLLNISAEKDNADNAANIHMMGVDGMKTIIFGAAFLMGQFVEEGTVMALFAFFMINEGLNTMKTARLVITKNTKDDNIDQLLGALISIYGIYMIFNRSLLNFNVLGLVGAAIFLIAVNRFRMTFNLNYKRPGFLTGTQEKLDEAKREEKLAMKKAKEGIRETKEIQRRIAKLNRQKAIEDSQTIKEEDRRRTKKDRK